MFEELVLSDLKAIQQLPPALQSAIAAQVSRFINLANIALSDDLLEQFFAAAMQDRQNALNDGASSVTNPRWAAASLKEAWCAAKLGKSRGTLPPASADAVVEGIEAFAFASGLAPK